MVLKLSKIFNILMRGKYINFSVFQLFGDGCFNEYLKSTLDLKMIAYDKIFVIISLLNFKFALDLSKMLRNIFRKFDFNDRELYRNVVIDFSTGLSPIHF